MAEPTPDTTVTGRSNLGDGIEPDVTIDDLPDPTEPPRKEFSGALRPFAILDRDLGWFEAFILDRRRPADGGDSVGNVIGRFVFGRSLYFAEEVNQFLIILITFAGIGYAARNGRHIRMSAFYDMLPPRAAAADDRDLARDGGDHVPARLVRLALSDQRLQHRPGRGRDADSGLPHPRLAADRLRRHRHPVPADRPRQRDAGRTSTSPRRSSIPTTSRKAEV
jgi:hypothetical protein